MTDTTQDESVTANEKPELSKCRCVFCGGDFDWYFKRNFCSQICCIKFKRLNKKIKITEEKVCLFCSKKTYLRKNAKFCSELCRQHHHLNKESFIDNEVDYTNKIFKDTGINISIKTRQEFFNWLQVNFFLFGLKSLHGDLNRIACENFAGITFTIDLRFFGDDNFKGLCFIKTVKSQARSLFILDNNIYMSQFLTKVIENQVGLLV